MPEILTYSLRASQPNSDGYFRSISAFSTDALEQAFEQDAELLAAFLAWCEQHPTHSRRTREEAVYELLSLGVLWRVYAGSALASHTGTRRLFSRLAALRKQNELLKPAVDRLRGWLGRLLSFHKRGEHAIVRANLKDLDLLLEWLAASGEFSEDFQHLTDWRSHLATLAPDEAASALQKIIDLAGWFEARSLEALGKFTPNVERFLVEVQPGHRWREDDLFTGRQRLEYHLNMFGTEILNRSLRESFKKTSTKIVVVPPCMKARSDDDCQATTTPFGGRCVSCTPGCRVNQLTRLGEKYGFQVFMIPDELKTFSSGSGNASGKPEIGLVGVSCPLTNAAGGWEMQRLGVPAQGLLLDYCGCSYHWHRDGIPTDVNFGELLHLVGENRTE